MEENRNRIRRRKKGAVDKMGETVLDTLRERYESLSATEKKIAEYILADPETAVKYNVSELATASGTSDATIIRFCKHAGYSGYYQLRILLSRELGRIESEQEPSLDSVSGIFQNYASNLSYIGQNMNETAFRKSVAVLMECGCVHIVAAGNTTPLGQYLGFRLGRIGIRATFHQLAEYFLNDVALADAKDVVFAISQSGASRQVVQAMELAKEKGLQTVAVVGYEHSPISRLADYLLPAVMPSQSFDYRKNYSHLSEMAVIDALLEYMTNLRSDEEELALQEILMADTKM